MDEECQNLEIFEQTKSSNAPACPPTTLTCFIHTLRLKRIESKIQSHIYRVDVIVQDLSSLTEQFLEDLAAWKNMILPQTDPRDDPTMNAYVGVIRRKERNDIR